VLGVDEVGVPIRHIVEGDQAACAAGMGCGNGDGARAQGSGLRAQGSGLRAQGLGLRAQGSGLRAQGSGLGALARTVRVPARLALRAAVGAEVDGTHALEGVEREEPRDDGVGRRLGRQSEGDPVAQLAWGWKGRVKVGRGWKGRVKVGAGWGGVEDKRRGGACLTALCSEADGAARRWRGWVKERGGGGGAWDWPGWGGWLAGG
jgi:hypothetical protein